MFVILTVVIVAAAGNRKNSCRLYNEFRFQVPIVSLCVYKRGGTFGGINVRAGAGICTQAENMSSFFEYGR